MENIEVIHVPSILVRFHSPSLRPFDSLKGYSPERSRRAAGQGFGPQFPGSEPGVLPLHYPATSNVAGRVRLGRKVTQFYHFWPTLDKSDWNFAQSALN